MPRFGSYYQKRKEAIRIEIGELFVILGKTLFLFFLTMFCFRLMGYRTLGDMEPMDYVIVLGIGEIMGSPLTSADRDLWHCAVAIITLTLIQILLSVIYTKHPKINKFMEGAPIPVIRNGRVLYKNLEKHRIDINTIREELRVKGYRDEKDVDRAYLEPSGRFSVILKNEASPLTPRYFGEKGSVILIENGNIRAEDWQECGVTEEEIGAFLEKEGIRDWKEVDTLLCKDGEFILMKKIDEKS